MMIQDEGKILPVIEEFYTLQGEGFHMGEAAYFIRIAGCDIACEWCDTKFSWNDQSEYLVSTDEVIKRAITFPAKAIVVTGGEPLQHNLDYLCAELKKNQIQTYLETSGAFPLSGEWHWICLSPKKQYPPLSEIYNKADELKVIIQTKDDFIWAEKNAKLVGANCKLFLQPEWSRFHSIINEVVEFIKVNPKWKISLQAHKFMQIP